MVLNLYANLIGDKRLDEYVLDYLDLQKALQKHRLTLNATNLCHISKTWKYQIFKNIDQWRILDTLRKARKEDGMDLETYGYMAEFISSIIDLVQVYDDQYLRNRMLEFVHLL